MTESLNRPSSQAGVGRLRTGLIIGALGVVFGDIGTSPIYTLQTVFNPDDPHPVPVSVDNIYGVVSLVFWSVMIIVTVTYVTLVMRADNDGEGGVMALITLIRRIGSRSNARTITALSALGILGAALFFGDSMITPAISVLSAVEGLKVVNPHLAEWIVPITALIILGLFSVQRHGTAVVGRFFGPVTILWFASIGACGVWGGLDPMCWTRSIPGCSWGKRDDPTRWQGKIIQRSSSVTRSRCIGTPRVRRSR